MAQALGKAGTAVGGVYRVGLPRTDVKANLTGGGKAAITGDFVLAALGHADIAKS